MLQCVFRRDSLVRVVDQHLLQQVQSFLVEARHVLRDVFLLKLREIVSVARKFLDALPFVLGGCASDFKNLRELIFLILAWKERLLRDNFSENTTNRPDVDRSVVVFASH